MELSILLVILTLFILMLVAMNLTHKNDIKDKVDSLNGSLIKYKSCSFISGFGPFNYPSRGTYIYKVTYLLNNERKEAWVKFGGFKCIKWVID